jgi:CheY-like chemotaxis protein
MAELEDARASGMRVSQIVRDLKLFFGPDDRPSGLLDVREVLDAALRMVRNEVRHRARVEKTYGNVALVAARESMIGHLLLNLLIRAVHAIPEGQFDANLIRAATETDGAGRVVVSIGDTGAAIAPGALRDMFLPSKGSETSGAGLGLTVCKRIVDALGGEITCRSTAGQGTEFRVALPPAPPPPRAEPKPSAPFSSRRRVLVLDDDDGILLAIRRVLGREHEVVTLDSAHTAVDRLATGERFDLILCDLLMPQMSGMAFYEVLRRTNVDQADRIAFLTGSAFTRTAREFLDVVPNPCIQKPFDAAELRARVRELFP